MLTDFFDVPPSPMSSVYSTMPARALNITKNGVVFAAKFPSNNSVLRRDMKTLEIQYGLRQEPWVIPILVLALISMLLMAAFEIFVLCKTRNTSPNRRHLFLGQMLLLGLFACAGLAALLTARPSTLSCATIRFGAGVGFAIIFASLLVKCIFLISLNSGVYLPAPYQALLLFFAVFIQVTIDVQWLMTSPPAVHFLATSESPYTSRLIFTGDAARFSVQVRI
jgi:7 transmembrane sweet-taste receptor of 3 GCPR